jgi:hypothetical protein
VTPRADWGVGGGPVEIALYRARLTDNRHAEINSDRASVAGVECGPVDEPTTFSVELRYRFGAS